MLIERGLSRLTTPPPEFFPAEGVAKQGEDEDDAAVVLEASAGARKREEIVREEQRLQVATGAGEVVLRRSRMLPVRDDRAGPGEGDRAPWVPSDSWFSASSCFPSSSRVASS